MSYWNWDNVMTKLGKKVKTELCENLSRDKLLVISGGQGKYINKGCSYYFEHLIFNGKNENK